MVSGEPVTVPVGAAAAAGRAMQPRMIARVSTSATMRLRCFMMVPLFSVNFWHQESAYGLRPPSARCSVRCSTGFDIIVHNHE